MQPSNDELAGTNGELPLDAPPLFYLSEPCDLLMSALADAGAELGNPPKDSTAKIDLKSGGSYSYKYADLATTLAGLRPVLAKHGLALIQSAFVRSGGPCVLTTIAHKSGQRLMTRLDMPVSFAGSGKDAAKDLGSAITYLRRYAVTSAFPIASDEDSDVSNIQGHARQVDARPRTANAAPQPRTAAPRPQAAPRATAEAAAPVSAPRVEPEAWPGQHSFQAKCRDELKRLGSSTFYQVLGEHGFERLKDVPNAKIAREIHKDLFERADPTPLTPPVSAPEPKAPGGAFTNGHGVKVDDDDLPPELQGGKK